MHCWCLTLNYSKIEGTDTLFILLGFETVCTSFGGVWLLMSLCLYAPLNFHCAVFLPQFWCYTLLSTAFMVTTAYKMTSAWLCCLLAEQNNVHQLVTSLPFETSVLQCILSQKCIVTTLLQYSCRFLFKEALFYFFSCHGLLNVQPQTCLAVFQTVLKIFEILYTRCLVLV